MKSLVPQKNTPEHDIVYTPKQLAKDIINYFDPKGSILEPCYGNGAFYEQYNNDIKYFTEISMGKDFFDFNEKVDWIITNPPWSKFKEFLIHSMKISTNIVFLVTINHFMTKARLKLMEENNFRFKEILLVDTPKENWPQSGFQLAAVYISKEETNYIKWNKL